MCHGEVGLKCVECIHLTQDTDKLWAFVNAVIKPSGSIKFGDFFFYFEYLRN